MGSDTQQQERLREVLQEIAVAGLVHRGFFGKDAFYGGTSLRIFHGLPRISEDLAFSLLRPDPALRLQPYLRGLDEECAALSLEAEVRKN